MSEAAGASGGAVAHAVARAAHRALVVVEGGRAQRYDAATSRWARLPPPHQTADCGPAAALMDGRVYVVCGGVGHTGRAEVMSLDPAAASGVGAWAAVAPMRTARRYSAAASLNSLLYGSGGLDGSQDSLRTVERYSSASGTWEAVAKMTSARHGHQLVALGGSLYGIGGSQGDGAEDTAERYDPVTNAWTPIASMTRARFRCAAAAMGDFLYVTGGDGGADETEVLRSCERYDPASNTWSRIADLPEPRWCHALACLDGSLYVVGGSAEGEGGLASTAPPWRYDDTADEWVPAAPLAAGSADMSGFGLNSAWAAL
jgi:N-acetylneuraminic acid mutarotase